MRAPPRRRRSRVLDGVRGLPFTRSAKAAATSTSRRSNGRSRSWCSPAASRRRAHARAACPSPPASGRCSAPRSHCWSSASTPRSATVARPRRPSVPRVVAELPTLNRKQRRSPARRRPGGAQRRGGGVPIAADVDHVHGRRWAATRRRRSRRCDPRHVTEPGRGQDDDRRQPRRGVRRDRSDRRRSSTQTSGDRSPRRSVTDEPPDVAGGPRRHRSAGPVERSWRRRRSPASELLDLVTARRRSGRSHPGDGAPGDRARRSGRRDRRRHAAARRHHRGARVRPRREGRRPRGSDRPHGDRPPPSGPANWSASAAPSKSPWP